MVLCLFVLGVCRVRLIRYLTHPANLLHHVCLLRTCLPSTPGSEITDQYCGHVFTTQPLSLLVSRLLQNLCSHESCTLKSLCCVTLNHACLWSLRQSCPQHFRATLGRNVGKASGPLEKPNWEIMSTDSLMEDSGCHSSRILPNERQINVPRWSSVLQLKSKFYCDPVSWIIDVYMW